ncbi:PREDICTED: tachykinin-like peptides receptor 86C isoform X1 [Acropora digitifera]|uniref:tachykinin-like peptides receptor 86C isoform X1 n=1 Tax=Acropora digitifera TaxID=70779 RepID=UPI00077AA1CC|nr:PREDICTED: tachykinin-like peptides receptor 86C isoform X1 [Acropora digitifera]XP_015766982.1 PREDICTED: tachykinin-like peptides receptor 86C isoform X1 [Acropora digitifera]
MNISNTSTDQGSNLLEERLSSTSKFIITFLYAASIVFGLAGNSIAIYFSVTKKAGNRITNMLILNMAIADLLVTIFMMPVTLLFFHVGRRWIGGTFGEISCKIVRFSGQVSVPASISIVMVVSIDRFFAVVYPMKARAFRLKIKMVTLAAWVCSVAYAIPYGISFGIQERDGIYHCFRCCPPLNNKTSLQIYYLITFIFFYCTPLLILMVLYTLMSRKLWKRKIPGNVTEERHKSSKQEKRRVIIALISITVVFAVFWFPAHVMHYVTYFRRTDVYPKVPLEIKCLFYWIGHFNSCVNPCLYVLLSRGYRRYMLQILQRLGAFCNFCGFHRSKFHSLSSGNEPALFVLAPCRLVGFTARGERVCARS